MRKLGKKLVVAGTALGLAVLALPWPGRAAAAGQKFEALIGMNLEELIELKVSLATGSAKPLRSAPAIASVITAATIAEIGATTLDEVLATVPGLHVAPSSNYLTSIWSLRGIHAGLNPQVLLLVNGVPFTSNYIGSRYSCFKMPTAMISRVEVVRGPGSALHGAEAFSGVVNVITKEAAEIGGSEVGGRLGSFGTYDTWLQHGGTYHGWEVALGVERQKSQGDGDRIVDKDAVGRGFPSNAPGPLDSDYDLVESHLNLHKGDWNFHLYGTAEESGAGPGLVQAITYGNDLDSNSLLADLAYGNDHAFQDWSLTGRLYYSYMLQDAVLQVYPSRYLNPNRDLYMLGNPIQESIDGGVEGNAVYSGFGGHQLRLGAGWKNFNFAPEQYKNFGPAAAADPLGQLVQVTNPAWIYIDKGNRHLLFALLQDEWRIAEPWNLTAGVRYDEYSDFGATINPRAALVWESLPQLTTKLMYGRAFRGPSFGEQNVKNNPQSVGNPNLNPEKIETEELAFDYHPTKAFRLALNLYNYDASQLIDLVGTLPKTFTNYGDQEGQGFEVEGDWKLTAAWRLRANFASQRARNTTVDAVVADAPSWKFYLNPHWEFLPDWALDGQFYRVGGRHRLSGDPRPEIADYNLVNLTLRRSKIGAHWEAALAVRNLFNEDAREPSPYAPGVAGGAYIPNDYPLESRSVWAELRYKF